MVKHATVERKKLTKPQLHQRGKLMRACRYEPNLRYDFQVLIRRIRDTVALQQITVPPYTFLEYRYGRRDP